MARCLLADGRCGRLNGPCRSGQCVARTVRRLQDRRWRDKLGLFAAEGEDLVDAAGDVAPVELLVAGETVEPALLVEVSTLAHPPRVIGVYRREDLPRGARPVTLALWHVADPGNVGTLLRSADAFGAGVALSSGCADPTGPKALRASAGSVWRVPLLPFEARDGAARAGKRVALVASGGRPLGGVDLGGEVVFLLGSEREGLPAELERDVDAWIPIGGAESLNVGVAGAIALYEWQRQNRG